MPYQDLPIMGIKTPNTSPPTQWKPRKNNMTLMNFINANFRISFKLVGQYQQKEPVPMYNLNKFNIKQVIFVEALIILNL